MKVLRQSILTMAILFCIGITYSTHSYAQNKTKSANQPTTEKTEQLLADYLKIKNALVQSDEVQANTSAQNMLDKLNKNEAAWAKKLHSNAKNIAESNSLEKQRLAFNKLSENIYAMIKSAKTNSKTLYKQYCPMAMEGEGAYWLSAEKEIYNPYFGNKMLHCGSVKETLKEN